MVTDPKFYYLRGPAHTALSLAIRHGDLIPGLICADCGGSQDRPLDGHHDDYSKPLEVIWLCRSCHSIRHRDDDSYSSRRLQLALDHLRAHPEDREAPCRQVAKKLGITHTTVNKAQRILRTG